jgi:nucleotide-binding universal stress UspA family protein
MAGTQRTKKGKAPWRNILVPVDGSAPSKRAVAQAASLARKLGASLILIHVVTPFEALVYGEELPAVITHADFERHAQRTSGKTLAAARKTAAGVACLRLTAWDVSAADAIAKAARLHRCDLVVMGSHGRRGLERLLLGSVAQKVLAGSRVPVMICR